MITSVQYIKWQASSSARFFSDDFFSVNNSYDYEEKNCYFLSLFLSSVAQIKKKNLAVNCMIGEIACFQII